MTRLAVSMRCRDQLDRRPGERRDLEQDIDRVRPGSRARRPPSSSCRLSGTGKARPGVRPRVRADELAPQLEREERIARRRLLHAGELGTRQLEPEPLLAADGAAQPRLSGPSEIRSSRSSGNERSSSNGSPSSGAVRTVAAGRRARRAGAGARSAAHRPRPGRATAASSSATSTGPCSARARSTSSTASPIACGSGAASPGLGEQQRDLERAPARRRERGRHLVEHRREQLREPGERERGLGLDAPADQHAAERSRASSTPASQRIVLPIPASPESTSAPGPSSTREERPIAPAPRPAR